MRISKENKELCRIYIVTSTSICWVLIVWSLDKFGKSRGEVLFIASRTLNLSGLKNMKITQIKIKQKKKKKRELLEALEMYYKVLYLGEGLEALDEEEKDE